MEDGAEITVDSVQQFVDGFRSDKLPKNKIVAVHKAPKNDNVSAWKKRSSNWFQNVNGVKVSLINDVVTNQAISS